MSLDTFIESLDPVPPELERNFTLMTDLDKRSDDVIKKINGCIKAYETTKVRSKREAIRSETDELFERLSSFADDKLALALTTYELVDKSIKRLENLRPAATNLTAAETPSILGCDMPLDPNEPKYCLCRGVSAGEMIACDNKECHIEWFHMVCVGLTVSPKGDWYCPNCISLKDQRRGKTRSRRSRR